MVDLTYLAAPPSLQVLKLRWRGTSFPTALARLCNLVTLSLRCVELRSIPENISTLVALKKLKLSSCDAELPGGLSALTGLQALNLSRWQRFHDRLAPPGLQSLDLSQYEHDYLPDIAAMTSLQSLDLSRSYYLKELPEAMSALTGLEHWTLVAASS